MLAEHRLWVFLLKFKGGWVGLIWTRVNNIGAHLDQSWLGLPKLTEFQNKIIRLGLEI